MNTVSSVTGLIGRTPLLELRRYLPSRKRRARYISRHEARRSRSRKYKETVQSH